MVTATINDELTLSYPKSFRVMGADELRQAYQADPTHIWGIRDEGRHAIVAIFTHDAGSAGKLFGKMVTEKDLAKRAEKKVRKAMRANGYRLGGFFSRELAGHPAHGFRYAYEVGDVAQSAQAIVLRLLRCAHFCRFRHFWAAQAAGRVRTTRPRNRKTW